jgi:mRNA interferase MazF
MARSKVAISLDESTLNRLDQLVKKKVFPNRRQAIEEAVAEKLARLEKSRLAHECAKLDPTFEKALAEEGLSEDVAEGSEYWGVKSAGPTWIRIRGREQAGLRSVLILSQDVFNERSGTVIAVAVTSQPQRAGFPLTLELHARGLPKRSWVKISQIRTLAVERIGKVIGRASPEELAQVIEGLNEIIGT